MVLEFFRGTGPNTIETVESTLVDMLRDVAAVYAASTAAVFGGGKSKETKREVKSTDRGVNEGQREVRRNLMMYAAVHDTVDLPLVLTYMSVVKDVERAGDYAKNLYDLAKYGADFEAAPDRDELERYRDAVGGLIQDACVAFENRDSERATKLIDKADGFLSEYDVKVREAYQSDGPASDAVARALYYRFLKRITAHLMNLMTSLVMPVDRLDYYDEAPDDRS
jgi:phosphate uptake regulator